jgi:hypothetical protein
MIRGAYQNQSFRVDSYSLYLDLVISFTIGPYYLGKNTVPGIKQDAGYWMLDTGLTWYSVDFMKRDRATPFTSIQ